MTSAIPPIDEEQETILENLAEGVIAVDSNLKVTSINFAGSRMLGIPKRHLLHKALNSFQDNPFIACCLRLLQECQERMVPITASFSVEEKRLYFELIGAPKATGKGAIIVLQDKSSHYKGVEVGKAFVANAAHELRTPITIIKGFTETIHEMPELPKEMFAEIIMKILRNCQRMENLIKNLLTLADIENLPSSRFKPCEMIALLEHCKTILLAISPETHIEIQNSKKEIVIAADSDLLELAIMNLLQNAVKYSSSPAIIAVEIEVLDEEIRISIKDRGIGIPTGDLEHIFEQFYTVDKTHSRKMGGAGLGLSIVKTIVEKHEGTISAVSEIGQGSIFTLLLPIHRCRMDSKS